MTLLTLQSFLATPQIWPRDPDRNWLKVPSDYQFSQDTFLTDAITTLNPTQSGFKAALSGDPRTMTVFSFSTKYAVTQSVQSDPLVSFLVQLLQQRPSMFFIFTRKSRENYFTVNTTNSTQSQTLWCNSHCGALCLFVFVSDERCWGEVGQCLRDDPDRLRAEQTPKPSVCSRTLLSRLKYHRLTWSHQCVPVTPCLWIFFLSPQSFSPVFTFIW